MRINGGWTILRLWLAGITVALLIAAFIILPAYFQNQQDEAVLQLACQSSRNQTEMLAALEAISRTLGLPHVFDVPSIPPECLGVSP